MIPGKRNRTRAEDFVNTCTTLAKERSWFLVNHWHVGMMDYPRFPVSEWSLGKFLDSMEFQSGRSTSELKFVC